MAGKNGVARKLVAPEILDIEGLTGDDVYTTERGFKLKILPVPWDLVYEARKRVPAPEPPLLQVYDANGKAIPGKFDQNYMDPTYIKQADEHNSVITKLTWQVMSAYGILAYAIPEGFCRPEDEAWVEELQDDEIFTVGDVSARIDVPSNDQPRRRFAEYLRLYVLTGKDARELNDVLLRGMKVLEQDVEEAVESFPGREG